MGLWASSAPRLSSTIRIQGRCQDVRFSGRNRDDPSWHLLRIESWGVAILTLGDPWGVLAIERLNLGHE